MPVTSDTDARADALAEVAEPGAATNVMSGRWMVPVDQITAHPGNVRDDLDLNDRFCASLSERIHVPLLVTPDEGGYLLVEGHRRYFGAVRNGITEVPCTLDTDLAQDTAAQFIDMAVANGDDYRRNFTAQEEADALFAASEAGATRTRIRKATGRTAAQVKAALQAGKLSGETRAAVAGLSRQLCLEELALLAEFEGDEDATDKLMRAITYGYGLEHTVERIRQDRAQSARLAGLAAELQAAGIALTEDLPAGAAWLEGLTQDGQDITPDSHASCPGHGVVIAGDLELFGYCTSPAGHGHIDKYAPSPAPAGGAGEDTSVPAGPADDAQTASSPAGTGAGIGCGTSPGDSSPDRKLVMEGNKAWAAAAVVRRRWLPWMLTRQTAPREAVPFLARQLLTMPAPLRSVLGTAASSALFRELTGQDSGEMLEMIDVSRPVRLPLLLLAPVITAYELEMTGADGPRRDTWREGRYSPCPRAEAGAYLAFLASLGYELSAIEQAVADGTPYTGDTSGEPMVTALTDPAEAGEAPAAA